MIFFSFNEIPQHIFSARVVYISAAASYYTLATASSDHETESAAQEWIQKQEQIRVILHKEIIQVRNHVSEQEIAQKSILELDAKITEFKRQAAKELGEMKEQRDRLLLLAAPNDDFLPASEDN